MQNSKGITLVSLVITIIVLLILASIATYSGFNVVNSSKLTAFTAELKVMQTQVNTIYQENKQEPIGQEITGDIQTQANIVFTESESGITSQDGYRYWNQEQIKELGIEEQDFLANVDELADRAFEDQCTTANPRLPLVTELKQILLDAYYGK